VAKFDGLAEPYIGRELRREIVGVVEDLERRPVTDLLAGLAEVGIATRESQGRSRDAERWG
jgi:hypothetical protein